MAYFRSNEPDSTQDAPGGEPFQEQPSWAEYQPEDEEEYYDDGFDQLTDADPEDDMEDDEGGGMRDLHYQTIFDISNLTATIIGAVLVLLLLQLLFSMIDFVKTDFELNFSMLMSRF